MPRIEFSEAGRLPMPGDNVAIAVKRLEAGDTIVHEENSFQLSHTILEGHRFAWKAIDAGEPLLSWELPFGQALRSVSPGEYVCNSKILNTLRHRSIDFDLPDEPNFKDHMQVYQVDEATFSPGKQVDLHDRPRTFMGYKRGGSRGVGTRNFVVLLSTTSLTSGFARALEARFKARQADFPNVDGVVAVTHTEGGALHDPNNRDFILRTLAGFMTHSNVAAVLAMDYGTEVINNRVLREFMVAQGYPLDDVNHTFFTVGGDFDTELQRASKILDTVLPQVDALNRSEQSVAHLKLALQCGGSDAFSGISGNPLAGWLAKEVIRSGGAANLAETDELIGAEPYVLSNVRDLDTARLFLDKISRFKERAKWHGHSAEGNPSGGNNYRGLYNIALKSIGAARKRDPEVRLDYVIDYAQPMADPGYYFMDSPGNDLESIAGQVASGANLILFITGNGSITNFPFAPTLKFVTTTGRWKMLANEMDVNAGRYQDGMPMDELGQETFELALKVASGQSSLGEKAGHSQVSIWRDWAQTDDSQLEALSKLPKPSGAPLPVKPVSADGLQFSALRTEQGYAVDQVGLVVPTSICSAQVARLIADRLNEKKVGGQAVSRFVPLVHTEGCGAAPGYSTQLYLQTVLGHLAHPGVSKALLLEHGCEQTHNDAMRHYLSDNGVDVDRLGWASVQMDGGIDNVMEKAESWFREALGKSAPPATKEVGMEELRLGLTATGEVDDIAAEALALFAARIANAGGLLVIPENATLLKSKVFTNTLLAAPREAFPTLGYGQAAMRKGQQTGQKTGQQKGLHIMEAPTTHQVETLTGLGATGVEVMLAHINGAPLQTHPMIPLLQVASHYGTAQTFAADLDLVLDPKSGVDVALGNLAEVVARVASREVQPRLFARGNSDFQLTRGWLGLSL